MDINEKIEEFSELKNYTSLHKALRILDDGHMARLAKKIRGFSRYAQCDIGCAE